MALANNISNGIGTGEAQILDTRGSVGKYTAELQRQAAQRAAEQKALQDQLGKVKIDGLRDADKADYFQGFEDWRNTAQKAATSRDFREKANLQSEADKKYAELSNLVNKSKEYNRLHQDISTKLLDNNFRDQFTDDAVGLWQQSDKLPLSDPRLVKDPSTLSRQLDLSKVDDKLAKIDASLLSKQVEANPVKGARLNAGDLKGTNLVYNTTVDPKRQAFEYAMAYDTDKDLKHYLKTQYADLYASKPEDEAKALAIQDMVSKRPIQKSRNQFVRDYKEDNWMEKANYMAALRDKKNGNAEPEVLYRQKAINDMLSGTQGSGELLKGIVASTPGYDPKKVANMIGTKGNFIEIRVPERTISKSGVRSADGKIKATASDIITPGYNVLIDKRSPDAKTKLNKVISDVTGEKISESKFQTGQASGKIKDVVQTPLTKTSQQKQTGMVTMVLPNGQTGQIAADKVGAFLKKYPKAKKQ